MANKDFASAIAEMKLTINEGMMIAMIETTEKTGELVRSLNTHYFSEQESEFEFHPQNRRGYKVGVLESSYLPAGVTRQGRFWEGKVVSTNPLAYLYEYGGSGTQQRRFFAHKKGEAAPAWRSRTGLHNYPAVGLLTNVAMEHCDTIAGFLQAALSRVLR